MILPKLNELAGQIHSDAKDKGFYNKPREIGTLLMLVVSELSEALEADRKGHYAPFDLSVITSTSDFVTNVKDTFEDEIADAIIRLLDLCGYIGIDIESHIRMKMEYNKTRDVRHGKNY